MSAPVSRARELVGKPLEEQDGGLLREGIRALAEALMETKVAGSIYAARHERGGIPLRAAHADVGHTRVGTIELAIPRSRGGTYFSSSIIERCSSRRLIRRYRRYLRPIVSPPHFWCDAFTASDSIGNAQKVFRKGIDHESRKGTVQRTITHHWWRSVIPATTPGQ